MAAGTPLTLRERVLYHQVHPLKLLVDWGTAAAALVLLWRGRLALALAVMLVPPALASALLVRFGRFDGVRRSRLGAYLRRWMTPHAQIVRLVGMAIAAVGAWVHASMLVAGGAALIVLVWTRGLLLRGRR